MTNIPFENARITKLRSVFLALITFMHLWPIKGLFGAG
jgi:hypothetical protein